MKILSITAQKPDSTGSGIYLSQMVKAFCGLGHTQAVIAGIAPCDQPVFPKGVQLFPLYYESDALPFPVLGMSDEMPYLSTRYRDMDAHMVEQFKNALRLALQKAVKEFEADLIICHHLYLAAACVRELVFDRPVVVICHGTDIRQMKQHRLERSFIIEQMQTVDMAFALHEQQKTEIIAEYGISESKVKVLGSGYDAELFYSEGRNFSAQEKLKLLYVGKLWEKKGVKSLIRALDLLPFPQNACELELIGGHSHEAELHAIQNMAALSDYQILFLGKFEPKELACAYRRNDIFVLPSFFEGLPLVVIEALACGCKVIVTDLPGIREWIDTHISHADVSYLMPPRMRNIDEPFEEDIPRFEHDIAQAIEDASSRPVHLADITDVSWDSLCENLLSKIY